MGNLSFSFLLFLAATMLVASSRITVTAHSFLSHDKGGLCQGTQYPVLCKAILKPGVHGAPSATNLAISAAILHTTQAKAMANSLIPTAGSSYMKSSLETCVEVYDDAIDDLVSAMKNVQTKDIDTLKENLAAAMSDYDACDEGFMELPSGICPMDNEKLRQFVSNCLVFADKIQPENV